MASDHEQVERSRRRQDDRNSERSRPHKDERDRRSRHSHRDDERPRSRDRRRRSKSPQDSHRRRRRSRDEDGDREGRRRRRRSREDDTDDRRRRRHRHIDDDTGGNSSEDVDRAVAKRGKSPLRRKGPLPSQQDSFAVTQTDDGGEIEKPKEKPNLGNTGRLAALSNSVAQADGSTIVLKYHEPAEARKPSPRDEWKLFVFKGGDIVDIVPLSARSCWLVGREMAVVDLPAEHPSISKQHAVIQFRYTEKRNEFGDKIGKVKPYLIDLESANGTVLNDGKVPNSRYLELRDKDIIQFGHSTREYVVMLAPKD